MDAGQTAIPCNALGHSEAAHLFDGNPEVASELLDPGKSESGYLVRTAQITT